MARAPLTPEEKTILEEFVKTLTETESQFCCGGSIQVPSERQLKLFYNLGASKQAYSITMSSPEPADIHKLLEAYAPAPHGCDAETVYDDSYRLARELHQDEFALTMDIVNSSRVMDNITALTSPRVLSGKLVADLYKLNSYSTGGFFISHRDTPKSDRHIGTLVVGLPVPFTGGMLRVSHEGKDMLFDLNATTLPTADTKNISLPWVFLFSDVEHEVLPVTSGTRVTLAYDIFISQEDPPSAAPVVDGVTLPLYSDLQGMLSRPEFLPQGGKLGVALSHAYPVDMANDLSVFASRLKGRDAALHSALLTLKVPIEPRAVYQPREGYYYDPNPHNNTDRNVYRGTPFPLDGYEPLVNDGSWYRPSFLFVHGNVLQSCPG